MPQLKLHRNRDEQIIEVLSGNPYLTLKEVGHEYGISKQRVQQIWKRERGTTPNRRPLVSVICSVCGEVYTQKYRNAHYENATHGVGEFNYIRNNTIVKLYVEDKLSTIQIAKIYNIVPSRVNYILHIKGVIMRRKWVKHTKNPNLRTQKIET